MKLRLIIVAMHCQFVMLFICVFSEKLFFRGENKNVLFFIRDYLKFFTVMAAGWLNIKSTASLPHEKFSGM